MIRISWNLKAILASGLIAAIMFSTSTFSNAATIDYKSYFNVSKIDLIDNTHRLIKVNDSDSDTTLYTVIACRKDTYTTERINLRTVPTINSDIVCALPANSKLLKVGESSTVGWDIVQIDNVNYFVWDEYLSDTPNDDSAEVIEITTIEPYLYQAVVDEQSDNSIHDNTYTYLGTYKLTAYCNCSICCGQWSGGPTASGTYPVAGRTIASDLPFGTQLLINGNIYIVEDRGVTGDHIDIYFNSHSAALAFGVQCADIYYCNNIE